VIAAGLATKVEVGRVKATLGLVPKANLFCIAKAMVSKQQFQGS
jgi:hypothetical protein